MLTMAWYYGVQKCLLYVPLNRARRVLQSTREYYRVLGNAERWAVPHKFPWGTDLFIGSQLVTQTVRWRPARSGVE